MFVRHRAYLTALFVMTGIFLAGCVNTKSGPQPTTSASAATPPATAVSVTPDGAACLKKAPILDPEVTAPDADVPKKYAQYVGLWSCGAWGGDLPTSLLVASMDKDGRAKNVVYAWGTNQHAVIHPGSVQTAASWQGDRFVSDNFSSGGIHIEFHLEGDVLKMRYISNKGFSYYADLKKIG